MVRLSNELSIGRGVRQPLAVELRIEWPREQRELRILGDRNSVRQVRVLTRGFEDQISMRLLHRRLAHVEATTECRDSQRCAQRRQLGETYRDRHLALLLDSVFPPEAYEALSRSRTRWLTACA